jgi:hypothetical protein
MFRFSGEKLQPLLTGVSILGGVERDTDSQYTYCTVLYLYVQVCIVTVYIIRCHLISGASFSVL